MRSAYSISSRVLPTPANVQHSGLPPGVDDAEKLACRDDVEAAAFADEQVEHGEVAIGLDGVADEVIETGERGVEAAEVVADGLCAVDVKGRTVFGGERGEVHAFATELALVVVEGVHGESEMLYRD